jgi:hypothetical protein
MLSMTPQRSCSGLAETKLPCGRSSFSSAAIFEDEPSAYSAIVMRDAESSCLITYRCESRASTDVNHELQAWTIANESY